MEGPANSLRETVAHAEPLLRAITEQHAAEPRAQGKWSPKEVIGHLLDSANNNLARFVRLQFVDHLLFEGYAQEDWVRAQAHSTADWTELVELWVRYNRHIDRLMELVPNEVRMRPRPRHNPLGSTYAVLPADGIPTLDWLMRDYVEHMKHHLRQIDPALVSA